MLRVRGSPVAPAGESACVFFSSPNNITRKRARRNHFSAAPRPGYFAVQARSVRSAELADIRLLRFFETPAICPVIRNPAESFRFRFLLMTGRVMNPHRRIRASTTGVWLMTLISDPCHRQTASRSSPLTRLLSVAVWLSPDSSAPSRTLLCKHAPCVPLQNRWLDAYIT